MAIHNSVVADVKSDLYATIASDGSVATLYGDTTRGDMIPVDYLYDASSNAADNFPDVIKPTLQTGSGRWVKTLYQQFQADWNQATGSAMDFIKSKPTIPAAASINNSPGRSLVSVANATNGYQISSSRNAFVNYTVTISTTATIAANASGTVVLEVASTNSSNPADWTEISRITNGQALSLAITLQSVQTFAGNLSAMVAAGQYVRQRTINNSGTPSFTAGVQQEILL